MSEGCIRGNASYGDGVYKAIDAGKTWTHLGLETTRQIGRLQEAMDRVAKLAVYARERVSHVGFVNPRSFSLEVLRRAEGL